MSEEEEINNQFADIVEQLDMRDIEEQVFAEEFINIEDVPTIVFMPIFTDLGMFYNSVPISTEQLETFFIWLKSQE